MEYRRRRRNRYTPQHSGTFPAYLLVVAIVGLSVYLFSASKAGAWVAENWIAPALSRASMESADTPAKQPSNAAPTTAPVTEAAAQTVTRKVEIPAKTYYALQIGVYDSAENAERQAEELRRIGAAGFVLADGERYRVLAAAYPDDASLKKVAAQLRNEGVESASYTFACGARTLTATGDAAQLDALEGAAQALETYLTALYDAVIAFDQREQKIEDGKASLTTLTKALSAASSDLVEVGATSDEAGALSGLLEKLAEAAQAAADAESAERTAFSAALKRLYLSAIQAYEGYVAS